MVSKSNFTSSGDSFTDAVAAGSHVFDFFAFGGENDIFGPHPSLQSHPFPVSEYLPIFFPEMPQDAPPALGATRVAPRSLQISYEPSTSHLPIVTPPHNTSPANSHDELTGTELGFTGLPGSPSGVLPPPPPPTSSSLSVTALPPYWIKVPQRNYDYGRRQWDFKASEAIYFSANGLPGINMRDALRKTFTGLDGSDDPVLQETPGAISCRLLFPGYPANNSSYQIHVLNWTRKRLPIRRSKLAHEVAKKVQRYLISIAKLPFDGSVEDRWKVGEGFMHIDNMFLARLVPVSRGSFQPEIWVVDPSASHAPPDRE